MGINGPDRGRTSAADIGREKGEDNFITMEPLLRSVVSGLSLVLIVSWACAAGEENKLARRVYTQPDGSTVELEEDPRVVFVELDAHLSQDGRETVINRLKSVGLEMLSVRPPGFPNAGEPQTLAQTKLAFIKARPRAISEIRQEIFRADITATSWCVRGVHGLLSLAPAWRIVPSGNVMTYKPAMVDACFNPKLSQEQIDSVIERLGAFGLVESPRELGWYDGFIRRMRRLELEYPDGDLLEAAEMIRVTMPRWTVRLIGVSWIEDWSARSSLDLRWRTDSLRVGDRTKVGGDDS